MSRTFLTALALSILLTGCAGGEEMDLIPEQNVTDPPTQQQEQIELPELPDASALEDLAPADFGCMVQPFETDVSTYPLLEGTELELTVTHLRGAEDGDAMYVVGGLHGDELAGWYAGELLKKSDLARGDVYILAPANRYGAQNGQRDTKLGRDLNRNFPGQADGVDARQVAYAIFEDIRAKNPALVLDLHEARTHTDGRDNLGNSIICLDITPIDNLVFELLEQSDLTTVPLDLFGAPPVGSLNRTVAEQLGIPVLTLETSRDEPISQRVRNQLRVTEFILKWYGLR